jgi:quercetin dioxygenase-like cupin family protein
MSFSLPDAATDPRYTTQGGIHVPAGTGPTKWFNGDVLNVGLTAAQTNGSLGVIRASVPPGGGPAAHVHAGSDEMFVMMDGELEFLDGDKTFVASRGDLVFVPRGIRHRFKNVGLVQASMVFLFTPGGAEGLFVAGGDEPQPGVQAPPWGLDRLDERLLDLLQKHDTEMLPEAP